jgi:hypothetical protein
MLAVPSAGLGWLGWLGCCCQQHSACKSTRNIPAKQRSNKMSARQRRGGSAPAPVQAYDTLMLALLQRVTLSDWHMFQNITLPCALYALCSLTAKQPLTCLVCLASPTISCSHHQALCSQSGWLDRSIAAPQSSKHNIALSRASGLR